MSVGLRYYQSQIVGEFEELPDGERVVLVAPTGSGKTVMASAIIAGRVERHQNVLVLAHRREIVQQTVRKLAEFGIFAGTVMAGAAPSPMRAVQVAAIQTLHARAVRASTMELPPADLIVVDEAHHIRARTWLEIIEKYPDATVLGLTATPCRGDGRGLGNIFTKMIECPQVAELIADGHLVKSRVYAPVEPDLTGVRTSCGDYVESALSARMNTDKLVGDIVAHWFRFGERRKTVVFAVDVKHSVHVADEFSKAGVRAEHLDGKTPTAERDAILARLASGETELVSNCMVLTEGWDMPAIGCLILARPTKQIGLFRQMVGRGLRPVPDKTDCIVLDHSGAVYRHGLPEDRIEWTLDTDERANNPSHDARQREHHSRLVECTQCSAIRTAGEPCPCCGFMPKPTPRYVPVADGDLGLVTGSRATKPVFDPDARREWHAMLIHIGQARGYKDGWASHKYKEKFKQWPPYTKPDPLPPTAEVSAWVRSRAIAYAKARGVA